MNIKCGKCRKEDWDTNVYRIGWYTITTSDPTMNLMNGCTRTYFLCPECHASNPPLATLLFYQKSQPPLMQMEPEKP